MHSRREALKTMAALSLVPAIGGCAAGGTVRPTGALDPMSVGGQARAFALMRGALDDRVVIGNVVGSYNGVTGSVVEPLFGLIGATFSRYRATPDGGFAIVSFEQAYYTTLDGSRVLDRFVNPYTGATVRAPVWTGEPTIQLMGADLRLRPARPIPDVMVSQSAVRMDGDPAELVFVERVAVDLLRDGGRRVYNEIVTLRAPRTAVLGRDALQVGCRTSYTSFVAWRDWLDMGDRPGHLMAHGAGGYGIDAKELPALFVEETRRRRPQALADPSAILDPVMRELDALLAP